MGQSGKLTSNSHRGRHNTARHAQFGNPDLARLSDEELLNLRFCDLNLRITETPLEKRIAQLERELNSKKIHFRPHFWLSDEWFVPDGVPGVAIPFFLADSRLMQLEQRQMLELEGGTAEGCMRILRHEAGHAIDNAYRLRRRKWYRQAFGHVSIPYPNAYVPRPYSRSYVVNIECWYAQSHPVEDFAETFAVWLNPRSRWRRFYHDWPALKKLESVDAQMRELRDQRPAVRNRCQEAPLHRMRTTLREHYQEKRNHYGLEATYSHDHDLRHLFSDDARHQPQPAASAFLKRMRPCLRRQVAERTGYFQYTIDQVLDDMIQRCRELQLRVNRPVHELERDALELLTTHTEHFIQNEAHKIAL